MNRVTLLKAVQSLELGVQGLHSAEPGAGCSETTQTLKNLLIGFFFFFFFEKKKKKDFAVSRLEYYRGQLSCL